jgi:hypothetical protein
MAHIRQTIHIRKLIAFANHYFEDSKPEMVESRKAIQSFVGNILHRANAYAGFRYLDGWPCADESRIAFYYDARLTGEDDSFPLE